MGGRLFALGILAFAFVVTGGFGGNYLPILFFIGVIAISNKSSSSRHDGAWAETWQRAADELDFKTHIRPKKRTNSSMRGEIDGHQVRVVGYQGGVPEIEVRFRSGFRSLDIEPRKKGSRASGRELQTGDPIFDQRFYLADRTHENDDILQWLTAERREILGILDDALVIDEIDSNELEVELPRAEFTSSELVQAVELCVMVAKILDESHQGIQDATRRAIDASPQDVILDGTRETGDIQDQIRE